MEKAILVGVQLQNTSAHEIRESLEELSRLTETAGGFPCEVIVQKRHAIDSAYYIGCGKAVELAEHAKDKHLAVLLNDGQGRLNADE